MRRVTKIGALVCGVIGLSVACGGGDDDDDNDTTATGGAGGGGTTGAGAGGTAGDASDADGGTAGGSTGGNSSTGGSSSTGGNSTGGDSSTGGSAGGSSTGGGGIPSGGSAGAPSDCQEEVTDTCEYPESLGGGGDSDACGVTPGAWYAIGDSDLATWPEPSPPEVVGGVFAFEDREPGHQVAFDPDGMPLVAWLEWQTPYGAYYSPKTVRVSRWNGEAWVELPPHTREHGDIGIDLAVTSDGEPVVLEGTLEEVLLKKFDGSEWQTWGKWPIVLLSSELNVMQFALDADDNPVVLYGDYSGVFDDEAVLEIKRWTGSAWESLGAPEAGFIYSSPALALRNNGDPVLAWVGENNVTLSQWSGTSWDELDTGDAFSEREGSNLALAVDADDQVIVAWDGGYRVWDGSEWVGGEVGNHEAKLSRNDAGTLYLATKGESAVERALYRWEAGVWESLPGALVDWNEPADLAVSSSGQVAAAFGGRNVYYRSYSDGGWEVLGGEPLVTEASNEYRNTLDEPELLPGPTVARGCAISEWNGTTWSALAVPPAEYCAFTRDSEGTAYVRFTIEHDFDRGDSRFHVMRQTADGWTAVGPPDAGGEHHISTRRSALSFDSENRPVLAWIDSLDDDVHVLAWDGSNWTPFVDSATDPFIGSVGQLKLQMTSDDRPVVSGWGGYNYEWRDDPWFHQVVAWNGEAWQVINPPEEVPVEAVLVLDTADTPVFTWPTQCGLEVIRWSGSTWDSVEPTDDVLESLPPSARVDVFSEEVGDDGSEVFARYFADGAWQGLSASDRGAGVSNSVTHSSYAPFFSATQTEVCVGWTESGTAQESNMLLRCHAW